MNKQANGQRAYAIKMGSIKPDLSDAKVLFKDGKSVTGDTLAKSRAKAIAARRKEFATA